MGERLVKHDKPGVGSGDQVGFNETSLSTRKIPEPESVFAGEFREPFFKVPEFETEIKEYPLEAQERRNKIELGHKDKEIGTQISVGLGLLVNPDGFVSCRQAAVYYIQQASFPLAVPSQQPGDFPRFA
jgi:hypothetical protein